MPAHLHGPEINSKKIKPKQTLLNISYITVKRGRKKAQMFVTKTKP